MSQGCEGRLPRLHRQATGVRCAGSLWSTNGRATRRTRKRSSCATSRHAPTSFTRKPCGGSMPRQSRPAMLEVICGTHGFADPPKTDSHCRSLGGLVGSNERTRRRPVGQLRHPQAVDVALWIANVGQSSAWAARRRGDSKTNGNAPRVYPSRTSSQRFDHSPSRRTPTRPAKRTASGVNGRGNAGIMRQPIARRCGSTVTRHSRTRGAKARHLCNGMKRNVDTFHQSITEGIYDNRRSSPASTPRLTTILGREAARRNGLLTWG